MVEAPDAMVERTVPSSETVGALLRRERENRGLSLDDVAGQTKIQRSYLEAIEADDLNGVPAGPFLTGFITSYARLLGLEESDVLAMVPEKEEPDFIAVVASQDPDRRGPRIEIRELPVGSSGTSTAFWIIGSILMIVVLGGFAFWVKPSVQGWMTYLSELGASVASQVTSAMKNSDDDPAPTETEDTPETSGDEKKADKLSSEPASSSEQAKAGQGKTDGGSPLASSPSSKTPKTGSSLAKKVGEGGKIHSLAPIQAEEDGEVYDVFTDPSIQEGMPQKVRVVAQHKSYLRVSGTLGGIPSYEGVLEAGQSKDIDFVDDLWMVVGNAGGIEISFNNNKLGTIGRYGERKGLAFRSISDH